MTAEEQAQFEEFMCIMEMLTPRHQALLVALMKAMAEERPTLH